MVFLPVRVGRLIFDGSCAYDPNVHKIPSLGAGREIVLEIVVPTIHGAQSVITIRTNSRVSELLHMLPELGGVQISNFRGMWLDTHTTLFFCGQHPMLPSDVAQLCIRVALPIIYKQVLRVEERTIMPYVPRLPILNPLLDYPDEEAFKGHSTSPVEGQGLSETDSDTMEMGDNDVFFKDEEGEGTAEITPGEAKRHIHLSFLDS